MNAIPMAPATARSWWTTTSGVLLLLAIASGAAAWWLIAAPVVSLARVPAHGAHFAWTYAHMLSGTVMLFGGALNLYVGATRRGFRWHRAIGRTYLGAGAVSASLAIVLALAGQHGKDGTGLALASVSDMGISLAALGAAWLITAALGLRAARNRRFDSHRDWMIRSYVLTWSFVACRLLGFIPAFAQLGDGAAAVWLTWIVPLLLCEVALQWRHGAPLARGA
jgi:hypothetical protein